MANQWKVHKKLWQYKQKTSKLLTVIRKVKLHCLFKNTVTLQICKNQQSDILFM